MGCAIALTVLKIMKRDHILEKVNENGIYLHDKLMKALEITGMWEKSAISD
ncbi:MAG: hypothetical protein ACLUIQ_02855 [Dialister invisus]